MKHMRITVAALVAASMLAACGGGSSEGDTQPSPQEVPTSATQSPAAYTEFAASLPSSDSARPLELGSVGEPPTSETALPLGA